LKLHQNDYPMLEDKSEKSPWYPASNPNTSEPELALPDSPWQNQLPFTTVVSFFVVCLIGYWMKGTFMIK